MQNQTIRDYLDALYDSGCSESTLAAYYSDLKQLAGHFPDTPVEQLTHEQLLGYLQHLTTTKQVKPSTIARKMSVFRYFYQHLVEEGTLQDNPTGDLIRPAVRHIPAPPITSEQVDRMLKLEQLNTRDRAILEVLIATGIRVTALANLNVDDVNLGEGTLLAYRGTGHEQTIALPDSALKVLDVYMRYARATQRRLITERALFLNYTGRRLSRQGVWVMVTHAAREAGITRRISPSIMRSTFAIRMSERGASLEEISMMMGHATLETTMSYLKPAQEATAA